jgi:hypothetical protein
MVARRQDLENMSMPVNGLLDAASALAAQTAGRTPDRACVLAGALALDTLCREQKVGRDIRAAAAACKNWRQAPRWNWTSAPVPALLTWLTWFARLRRQCAR